MKAVLREVLKEVLEREMPESLGAGPRGSAQKAGKASGPAIPAGLWWCVWVRGGYGYRGSVTVSSPPRSWSDPGEARRGWWGRWLQMFVCMGARSIVKRR